MPKKLVPVLAGGLAGIVVGAAALAVIVMPLGEGDPSPTATSRAGASPSVGVGLAPSPSAAVTPAPPSPSQLPNVGVEVGQLAPEFELRTPEGEVLRLSDYRGRPLWINFWAPWCPACRTEMPRLEGMYLDHLREGLVILGVGVRDDAGHMREYAGEVGVSYPIVVDADGRVAEAYRAFALPVHYWIDRGGVVRDWAFGELPPDALAASLGTVLDGEGP